MKHVPVLLLCTQIYKIMSDPLDKFSKLIEAGLLMKDLSQHVFVKNLLQYKQQFNTLRGLKVYNCILLISK